MTSDKSGFSSTEKHPTGESRQGQVTVPVKSHHSFVLIPHPSDDPKDPLRWPRWLKISALIATAMFNFTANFAGAGLSVATPELQAQYHKSAHSVNGLLTFNFLLVGVGNIFWVPMAVKYGKRFALLTSMAMTFAVLVWNSKIDGFNSFLAARCLSGFASSAGESIVPGIVNDIFFLHEHASMMSGYTVLISSATAIGPLVASAIVQYTPGGWVAYMWLCAAIAGFNLLILFLFYPESSFNRPEVIVDNARQVLPRAVPYDSEHKPVTVEVERATETAFNQATTLQTRPKSLSSIWTSFITPDHSISLGNAFLRPLVLALCPDVLYATFVYGTALAAQVILIYAFPSLLMAPPYFFDSMQVGLMQIAAIIGFVIACVSAGYAADAITTRMIIRQSGIVSPEQRLVSLIPGCFIAPVGCIVVAFSCAYHLTWVAIAFGFGMVSFGTVYAPNIIITYIVESRPKLASEAVVTINVVKNMIAFMFLYTAVDWIAAEGWIQVYMIMFMLVTLSMLLAIPFYFYGAKTRASTARLERLLL